MTFVYHVRYAITASTFNTAKLALLRSQHSYREVHQNGGYRLFYKSTILQYKKEKAKATFAEVMLLDLLKSLPSHDTKKSLQLGQWWWCFCLLRQNVLLLTSAITFRHETDLKIESVEEVLMPVKHKSKKEE